MMQQTRCLVRCVAALALAGLLAEPAIAATAPATSVPKLSVEAFAALPLVQQLALSPDGQKVAMMVNAEGSTTIAVQHLGPDGKRVGVMSTDNKQYSFNWFRWMGSDRLLVSTRFPARRASDFGDVPTTERRLVSANIDGSGLINLIKPPRDSSTKPIQVQDRVLDFEPDDGRNVLLMLPDPDYNWGQAVFRVDVRTGERVRVHRARRDFVAWMVDRSHRVRLGLRVEDDTLEVHVCEPDGENWRKLWTIKPSDTDAMLPLGFGRDPNQLYVLSGQPGSRAVFTLNLRDPDLKRELVLAVPERDLAGSLVYSRKTDEAVGMASASEIDEAATSYWDRDRRELVGLIDQALPGRYNRIVSMSADESRYLVYSGSSQTPGTYYLGDDRAGSMAAIALTYPRLSAKDMAPKQVVQMTLRDGFKLPGYLSVQQDLQQKLLPLVILLPDEPDDDVYDDFQPMTQFLVNRGYAVLQPSSRVRAGLDVNPLAKVAPRLGLELQDDISDAARWAADSGLADASRICVVGALYGGYAALMGVAKTPDLFRCAASLGGVSDLYLMGQSQWGYNGGMARFERKVGVMRTDKERMKATSPRFMATAIKAPVLLVHGTHDRVVPIEQSQVMAEALAQAGKAYRFVKQERGDHGLRVQEHRLEFFKELEAFLEQNIGAGAATK